MSVTVHRYDAFGRGSCDWDDGHFEIELGPGCRLEARVSSREYDGGKYSSRRFIQSEALITPGRECTLALRDGRKVFGAVTSGGVHLWPTSLMVVVALEATWSDAEGTHGGLFRIRADANWDQEPVPQAPPPPPPEQTGRLLP